MDLSFIRGLTGALEGYNYAQEKSKQDERLQRDAAWIDEQRQQQRLQWQQIDDQRKQQAKVANEVQSLSSYMLGNEPTQDTKQSFEASIGAQPGAADVIEQSAYGPGVDGLKAAYSDYQREFRKGGTDVAPMTTVAEKPTERGILQRQIKLAGLANNPTALVQLQSQVNALDARDADVSLYDKLSGMSDAELMQGYGNLVQMPQGYQAVALDKNGRLAMQKGSEVMPIPRESLIQAAFLQNQIKRGQVMGGLDGLAKLSDAQKTEFANQMKYKFDIAKTFAAQRTADLAAQRAADKAAGASVTQPDTNKFLESFGKLGLVPSDPKDPMAGDPKQALIERQTTLSNASALYARNAANGINLDAPTALAAIKLAQDIKNVRQQTSDGKVVKYVVVNGRPVIVN